MIDLAMFAEGWGMEPTALHDLYLRLTSAPPPIAAELAARFERGPSVVPTLVGSVATVPMRGVMMKRVPEWMQYYGVDAVETGAVARALEIAAEDPEVRTIVLKIDSPGGQITGVPELTDTVRAISARKPVHAVVEDTAASAAYWVASAASSISAPPSGKVGSIGAYMVAVDTSKRAEDAGVKVHVVGSGPLKGMGEPGTAITPEHLAHMKGLVDGVAGDFVAAVGRGRRMGGEKVKELATGRMWRAGEAKALGLIDQVEPAATAVGRIANTARERFMADVKEISDAKASALAEERARTKAINDAFGAEDPEFARQQCDAGATLEQASVAYVPRMRERAKKLEGELAAARTQKPEPQKTADAPKGKTEGVKPVPHGEAAGAGGDFMAVARARAKADGTKLTPAMQAVAKEQPQLHRDFVEASSQKRVKLSDLTGATEPERIAR